MSLLSEVLKYAKDHGGEVICDKADFSAKEWTEDVDFAWEQGYLDGYTAACNHILEIINQNT